MIWRRGRHVMTRMNCREAEEIGKHSSGEAGTSSSIDREVKESKRNLRLLSYLATKMLSSLHWLFVLKEEQ